MSPAMSALASIGLTHQILILIVLALVAAGVIGLFWHYILPGAIIILVASLFYVAPDATPTKQEVKVETEKAEEVFDEYQAYMKDCMEVAEYSMFECKNLWNGRKTETDKTGTVTEVSATEAEFRPVSDTKLLDVANQEYKSKRASAINKPNAVVMQATYR